MKAVKTVLAVCFILAIFASYSQARNTGKEEMKKTAKDTIVNSYKIGAVSHADYECNQVAEIVRENVFGSGLTWNESTKLLHKTAFNACLLGRRDRTYGDNFLPMLLDLMDIAR